MLPGFGAVTAQGKGRARQVQRGGYQKCFMGSAGYDRHAGFERCVPLGAINAGRRSVRFVVSPAAAHCSGHRRCQDDGHDRQKSCAFHWGEPSCTKTTGLSLSQVGRNSLSRIREVTKHPGKDRIDVFGVVAEVEVGGDSVCAEGGDNLIIAL